MDEIRRCFLTMTKMNLMFIKKSKLHTRKRFISYDKENEGKFLSKKPVLYL